MENNIPELRVGDSVQVKEGVMDPDIDGVCIEGWQGRISLIEDMDDGTDRKLVCIEWDTITLQKMPERVMKFCDHTSLSFIQMYLFLEEIVKAAPRDTQDDVARLVGELRSKYDWI